MSLQKRLMALMNIRADEAKLVLLLILDSLLVESALILVRTAAYALFVVEFSAETLPYVYVGFGLAASIVSFLYMKLGERTSLSKLLMGNLVFRLLLVLGLRLALTFPQARWFAFALPVAFGVLNTLSIVAFTSTQGRLFNIEQGKRLFGLLGVAGTAAIIAIGFLTPVLVGWVGTANLILMAGGLLLGSLVVYAYIARTYAQQLAVPPEEAEAEDTQTGESPLKSHYVRLIAGMFVLFILTAYFLDNIFYIEAEMRFPDADQMSSFLGIFYGVLGVLTLIMQAFVASPVLRKYGVRVVILIMPTVLTIGVVLFALSGTFLEVAIILFALAIFNHMTRMVLDVTDGAATEVLFQPLPAEQRTRAQTTVYGVVYPSSVGLTGVVLLFLTQGLSLDVVQLAYVLIAILAGWLAIAVLLGREYPRKLREALEQRSLGGFAVFRREHVLAVARPDRSSLVVLKQALRNPRPGAVIYALDVLEEIDPDTFPDLLPDVLEHRAEEVRLDVLRRVERLRLASVLPAISRRLPSEGSFKVQGASLRVMGTLGDSPMIEEVYPYLEASEPALKMGAMVGLLRSGEIEGMVAAGERLIEWQNAPDPAARRFAAQVLGQAGIRTLHRPLLKLIRDEVPSVQRAALDAAGRVRNPSLWPAVIDTLALPSGRAAAMDALVAGGGTALPALRAACNQAEPAPKTLICLVQVNGRIGGPEATDLLRTKLDYPEMRVRSQVLEALHRCGYQAQDRDAITERIEAEVAQATWVAAALADIEADASLSGRAEAAISLLKTALTHTLGQHRDNLFLWLSFIYDPQLMRQVRAGMSPAADARTRSYAGEIIEVQVESGLKALLMPVVEDLSPEQRLQRLSASFPQSRQNGSQRTGEIIAGSPAWFTPWLRACALHAAAELEAMELAPEILSALGAPEPLVRETAIHSLTRLDPAQVPVGLEGERSMLSPVEKVIQLKAVPFFTDVPEEELAAMAGVLKEREVEAGQTIVAREQEDSSLYIIVSGQVRVDRENQEPTTLSEDDTFGELAILDPGPQPAEVTAVEDTYLLQLDQEPFRELVDEHRDVAWKIMQLLARRLRRAQRAIRPGRPTGDILSEIQEQLVDF